MCVGDLSNVIPVWSASEHETVAKAGAVKGPGGVALKMKEPNVTKMSRGVNVLFGGPACAGAIAKYFSAGADAWYSVGIPAQLSV
jgi:hypothetical protein